MVDASLVLDAIVAVSIAAGALFAIVELREIGRDRKTQLVLDIMRHASTVEFREQMRRIEQAPFSSGPEGDAKCGLALEVVSSFNEQIGLLLKMKLIDANLVHESVSMAADWEMMKPWCLWQRDKYGPGMFENFEYAVARERAWVAKRFGRIPANRGREMEGV